MQKERKEEPKIQTFLPYEDFTKMFKSLDYRRLGKQRVEAMQILNILENKQSTAGWKNHPAVLMWIGYEDMLKYYTNMCIIEWMCRGYKNTMQTYEHSDNPKKPWWLGNEDFHRAMRARLIEKNEAYYLPLFPDDKGFNDAKYFWPVNETKTFKII